MVQVWEPRYRAWHVGQIGPFQVTAVELSQSIDTLVGGVSSDAGLDEEE